MKESSGGARVEYEGGGDGGDGGGVLFMTSEAKKEDFFDFEFFLVLDYNWKRRRLFLSSEGIVCCRFEVEYWMDPHRRGKVEFEKVVSRLPVRRLNVLIN